MMQNIKEHPESTDYWLDAIHDATTRATEWDAERWGLDRVSWREIECTATS